MRRSAESFFSPRAWWALLALGLLGLTFLLFGKTLGNAWAYDDVDYINHSADYLAGKIGLFDLLLRPQGEHLVALFRLLLLGSLKLFGMSATPFRALTLVVHATAALLLALIARRYTASRTAAATTALAYVLPCGFSTMWIWFPSGSCVPWAITFYCGAMLAIAERERLGVTRARAIALGCVLIALGFETTHAPLAVGPLLLDEYERRRHGKPRAPVGLFTLLVLGTVAATAAFSAYQYHRIFGPSMSIDLARGIPRAVFLLALAPLRLFLPSTSPTGASEALPWAARAAAMGAGIALPLVVGMAALWRRKLPSLSVVAILSLIGPIGVVSLCGLGRWRNAYQELDYAGRYLFTLLMPTALLAGAIAASLVERGWFPRRARWALPAGALLLLGATDLALRHRSAMLARIPFDVYAAHAARYRELGALAEALDREARALPHEAPPLAFPDTSLWLQDVHNGRISTRILVEVMARERHRLRLGERAVSARDQAILNPILESWARARNEPLPYLSIVDGKLRDAHFVHQVDFRSAELTTTIGGFYEWDGHGRWMGQTGTLDLRLPSPSLVFVVAAPISELRRADPEFHELTIDVAVIDAGVEVPLGKLHLAADGEQLLRLNATPYMATYGAGRPVRLVLRASRTWIPAEVIPGSTDQRAVSVLVFIAGAELKNG